MTTTIYPGLQRQQQQCISEGVEGEGGDDESHYNKVDHVCVAVRRALTKLGANKYLLSIITTHVKMTHPELETVLGMIKQLKGKKSHVCLLIVNNICITIIMGSVRTNFNALILSITVY